MLKTPKDCPSYQGRFQFTWERFGTSDRVESLVGNVFRPALSLPGLQVTLVPWTFGNCGDGTTHTLHNVIAWIPGSGHPNRLIVIGGHYDSRTTNGLDGVSPAPGANDSGSQTALVLEAARVMSGHVFDATVVFADWSGEEQGLQGSSFFVQHYLNYFPNGALELNFNSDSIGGDNTVNSATTLQQFNLFSPGTPRERTSTPSVSTDDTSPSRGIMRHIGYWGGAYVPTMTMLPQLREDRPGRTSDHSSFISRSIPGVRFYQVNGKGSHEHSPNDLYIYVTHVARDCRVHFTVRRFASAVRVARGSTESRRTGGGCAGYQDILESHRRLVVEIFLDNAPAILVQAAFKNT